MNGNMWDEEFNFLSREAPAADEDLACFFQTADKHIGGDSIKRWNGFGIMRKRRN